MAPDPRGVKCYRCLRECMDSELKEWGRKKDFLTPSMSQIALYCMERCEEDCKLPESLMIGALRDALKELEGLARSLKLGYDTERVLKEVMEYHELGWV